MLFCRELECRKQGFPYVPHVRGSVLAWRGRVGVHDIRLSEGWRKRSRGLGIAPVPLSVSVSLSEGGPGMPLLPLQSLYPSDNRTPDFLEVVWGREIGCSQECTGVLGFGSHRHQSSCSWHCLEALQFGPFRTPRIWNLWPVGPMQAIEQLCCFLCPIGRGFGCFPCRDPARIVPREP